MLATAWGWVSSAVGSLVSGFLRLWGIVAGVIVGWQWHKSKTEARAGRIKEKQLEIANRPKLRRDQLLERMRSRKR